MKLILCWLFVALGPFIALSQTKITKFYPVKKGQTVAFQFDFPNKIKVSNWNKQEIAVLATIETDEGVDSTVFKLVQTESDGKILIKNTLDMDKIPYSFYVVENGIKKRFETKKDMNNYLVDKSDAKRSNYQTRNIDIKIEIKVPENIQTEVKATYGVVEIQDFIGPINVEATYGGIEAKLKQQDVGKLKMTNRFGKIYTNFTLKPNEIKEERFYTAITANPGQGASYDLNSSYGNIYLRNP
ncbi:MAG: hypothetical protein EOO86_12930 [Pedobacter sp.]|nr:MAG: hypothetical protein EOO86_12930 [Pedobacter sp.]